MNFNLTRRKLLQWLGALVAHPSAAQGAPKGLTSDMSDPSAFQDRVDSPGIHTGLTGHGHIVELNRGPKKFDVPFHARTFLAGSTHIGMVNHRVLDSGGVEYRPTSPVSVSKIATCCHRGSYSHPTNLTEGFSLVRSLWSSIQKPLNHR